VLGHFLFDQRPTVLTPLALPRLFSLTLLLQLTDLVLQPRRPLPVGPLRCLVELQPLGVELLLQPADRVELVELGLPLRFQRASLLLERGELLLQALQSFARGRVFLLAQALTLDLQLHDATAHLVQLGRGAGGFHAQPRRGLVHQVDGLVGQIAIGDVAVR
jgi:hypothetical protein